MLHHSHHLFVAAVFLLLSIFGVENFSLGNQEGEWPGTYLPKGCYTFIGKVQCPDPSKRILPTAKVILWEWDELLEPNDEISTAKVYPDGTYKIEGCAEDTYLWIPMDYIQLFLRFYDVCEIGDQYVDKFPQPSIDQTSKLSMYQANWVQDNPSSNQATSGRKLKKMPKSNGRKLADYPPMPRPYSHRISNDRNLGYIDSADVFSDSSMPKYHRRLKYLPPTPRPYDNRPNIPTPRPYDNRPNIPTSRPYDNRPNIPTSRPYDSRPHHYRLINAGTVYNVRPKRSTLPKEKKFTFKGRVECYSPEYGITPTVADKSVVKLMEADFWDADDLISATKIKPNGEFEVSGEATDGWWLAEVDLILLFQNVCWVGDSYKFKYPLHNDYTLIRLNSNGDVEPTYSTPNAYKYIRG